MSETVRKWAATSGDTRIGPVLSAQPRRILRALLTQASREAEPVLWRNETLSCEEHVTLWYELHHVILPELEDDGLVEFDRSDDRVRRGPRFNEVRPLLDQFDAR